jgi:hypothetical protein
MPGTAPQRKPTRSSDAYKRVPHQFSRPQQREHYLDDQGRTGEEPLVIVPKRASASHKTKSRVGERKAINLPGRPLEAGGRAESLPSGLLSDQVVQVVQPTAAV